MARANRRSARQGGVGLAGSVGPCPAGRRGESTPTPPQNKNSYPTPSRPDRNKKNSSSTNNATSVALTTNSWPAHPDNWDSPETDDFEDDGTEDLPG